MSDPTGTTTPTTPAARPDNVPEKFWDAEKGAVRIDDVLKANSELEKKLGAKAPAGTEESTPTPNEDEQNANNKAAEAALRSQGLELNSFIEEYATNGVLSDQSYEALEKAGFSRGFVDRHIEGQVALGEEYNRAAMEAAGGEDNFGVLINWAKANYTPAELEAYNKEVMGSKKQMVDAVTGLRQRFESATGKEPALLQGGPSGKGDVFNSMHELKEAQKDKRYGKDRAYTKSVMDKLSRSGQLR